jgi:subtilisin family serine protease
VRAPQLCFAISLVASLLPAARGACDTDHSRELVVCLSARPGSAPSASLARAAESFAARSAALGLRVAARLDEGLPQRAVPDVASGHAEASDPFDLDPASILLVEAADAEAARTARAALATDPSVAWVEDNPVRTPAQATFPNDPLFQDSRQWGLRNLGPAGIYGGIAGADIHALGAWAISVGANDILLAVADTGIDPDQPDLAATLPDGSSRIAFGFNSTRGPDQSVLDTFGHGTPVTGVMAARTNDGAHFDSLGAAGVCGGDGAGNFGCRIVPIKITQGNSGDASAWDIARAAFYATRMGCSAMNLSFAGDLPSNVERLALRHAITHGCVVVTAIGNRGFSFGPRPQYPAAYAAEGLCIAVGASDERDERAVFSSYGPGLDVVAPGVDIWTTFMTYPSHAGAIYPGYLSDAGTSFATPFVTGTVGLLAAYRRDLDAGDYQSIIRLSADDVGAPGPDEETGWGRLNAEAALERLGPDVSLWHGEAPVTELQAAGTDTVLTETSGAAAAGGSLVANRVLARYEARATIAIPDSFAGAVEVWPRARGTLAMSARSTSRSSWSEVVSRGPRSVTLRGYLYRPLDAAFDDRGAWLPVSPEDARLAFTVIGKSARSLANQSAPPRSPSIRATPNPFHGQTWLFGSPHSLVGIFDIVGRRVRGLQLDASGEARWDGRRDDGTRAGVGLYLARLPDGRAARLVRLP